MSRVVARGLRSVAARSRMKITGTRAQLQTVSLNADDAVTQEKAAAPETKTFEVTALDLDVSYPTYMIWGANTGVGKTLVSAGLTASILPGGMRGAQGAESTARDVLYLKPVQTGYPSDSDARFVAKQVSDIVKRRRLELRSDVHIRNQFLNASAAVRRAMNSDVVSFPEVVSYVQFPLGQR